MSVVRRLRALLIQKKGDGAVSFILTTAMLVLLFATLLSTMIYVMNYYNTGYACRRIVRGIETTGAYDAAYANQIIDQLDSPDLEDLDVSVNASYFSGSKIQLRNPFTVTVTGNYIIKILQLGETPIIVTLPIEVKMSGMSEVYWK